MNQRKAHYESDDEIRALVEGFESCSLPDDDFDHRAHLAVAVWYLSSMNVAQAAGRMREGLLRFLAHYEVDPQKYNETITLFWVRRLDKLLSETDSALPLCERANQTIDRAGDSQTIFDYYTRERAFSEEGRTSWIQPDLKEMENL
ncbi:MAG: hypothetical protein ICV60_01670 [Pyrinomonadaceae bacterium]|nr:hypothetical protein [Pyrinomonadaceae bacterium]